MSKKMNLTLKEKLNEISIDELDIHKHVVLLKKGGKAIYRLTESRDGNNQYMWTTLTSCGHGGNGMHNSIKRAIDSVISDGEVFVITGEDLTEAINNI